MKRGGLIDRARGFLRARKERRAIEAGRQEFIDDLRRRGREWVTPRRGGEHRPVWKMVPSPGPQRDALRNERRARRRQLNKPMMEGIVGATTVLHPPYPPLRFQGKDHSQRPATSTKRRGRLRGPGGGGKSTKALAGLLLRE